MKDPYKMRVGEYMYCEGVNYYVMTLNGICICDTWQEKDELVAEALSYEE